MTLKHLRIFLTVYQTQNVTEAAEVLHMTQPAITRAIKEMEDYYGVKVFDRINHRICNNECGKDLYEKALHIVSEFDEIEKNLREQRSGGSIRIGTSITIGNFFMPHVLANFKTNHPLVHISVSVSNTNSIVNKVLSNELDFGLVEGSVYDEHIITEAIGGDELIVLVPLSDEYANLKEMKLQDLSKYPLLLREEGSALRDYLEHLFAVNNIQIHPILESVSNGAVLASIEANLGIGILPSKFISELNGARKVNISDYELKRTYYLIYHKDKFFTKAMNDFREDVKREML